MVQNYQNDDRSLRKKIIVLFIIIFGTLSFLLNHLADNTSQLKHDNSNPVKYNIN